MKKNKKKWIDEFKGNLFFLHIQSNFCGVSIGFIGNASFEVSNKRQDKSRRILILDVKLSENDFLLINLYSAYKESEHLQSLSTPCNPLDNITDLDYKIIILGGDYNANRAGRT